MQSKLLRPEASPCEREQFNLIEILYQPTQPRSLVDSYMNGKSEVGS